jgi:hypothetical protein
LIISPVKSAFRLPIQPDVLALDPSSRKVVPAQPVDATPI